MKKRKLLKKRAYSNMYTDFELDLETQLKKRVAKEIIGMCFAEERLLDLIKQCKILVKYSLYQEEEI